MAVEWLDADGRFKFGKHAGELAEDVVSEDPGYVRWIMNNTGIDDEDCEVLEALMSWKGGE